MNKQTRYKLLEVVRNNDGATWEENSSVIGIMVDYSINKITHAKIRIKDQDDQVIFIDEKTAFLQEFTGMFDRNGVALYGYDIVKLPIKIDGNDPTEIMLPIVWINASWCLALEDAEEPVYLNHKNVMTMEKVGNMYQHGEIVEKSIDMAIFEAEKEN